MKSTLTKIFVLLVSVGLVSCSSTNNQPVNTGMGAESGQTVAMGSGAGVGMVGGDIGQSMDSSDTIKSYAALEHNPKNKAKHWTNKKTGNMYTFRPTSKKMAYNGNPVCRNYVAKAKVDGKKYKSSGTACRQSDGTWQTLT